MAEGPPPENSDAAVRNYIEYVALGFVLEAIAAFYRGDSVERVVGGLGIGAIVSFIGFKWGTIKVRMGPRFTRAAINVATDFRWWLAWAFVVFMYLGAPSFIGAVVRVTHQQTVIVSRPVSVSTTDVATTGDKASVIACPPVPTPSQENRICEPRLNKAERDNAELRRQIENRQHTVATIVQNIQKQDYIQQVISISEKAVADHEELGEKWRELSAWEKSPPEGPAGVHSEPLQAAGEREQQDQRALDKLKADFKHELDSLISQKEQPNN